MLNSKTNENADNKHDNVRSRENVNQMCLRESSTMEMHCTEHFDDYRKFDLKTRSYKASLGSCFSFRQENQL
ncbi:unnamed protein product [Moneuplotes crassus]|uniref:Uncharacterized protein n=1 Tax=Euplotes crassus TaxID=5936 RepID=A0AAD2D6L7_EUPCR|nr:unnamed protein product [Moneuplotes crassus]